MKLIIEVKNVYGVPRVYPVCAKSHSFARIAGLKTLSPEVIEEIKKMGYKLTEEKNRNMKTFKLNLSDVYKNKKHQQRFKTFLLTKEDKERIEAEKKHIQSVDAQTRGNK
jgi:competence transcription factor ComK